MTDTQERFKRALADGFAAADEARHPAEEESLLSKIQARRPPTEECPTCAIKRLTVGTMELRFNTRGKVAFTPFFGCSRWPVCQHTRPFNHATDERALRGKMPAGTYHGFVRAFDGPRAGEVFWVEGSTTGTDKMTVMTVFVSETVHSIYRLNQLVVWEPQPHEAVVEPDGTPFAFRSGVSISGVASTLGFRPLTHMGKAFVVPQGAEVTKNENAAYYQISAEQGSPVLRIPPHPVPPLEKATQKEETVPAYSFPDGKFVTDTYGQIFVSDGQNAVEGGRIVEGISAISCNGTPYILRSARPWIPKPGDLVHVGDLPQVFEVVKQAAHSRAFMVRDSGGLQLANHDELQPLVDSTFRAATVSTPKPTPFYHDRYMEPFVPFTSNTLNSNSTTNQETPMTEEKKPRIKKTMKEQGSVIMGAMATGAAMGATSQAGELILSIGKKLSKNSPLLGALLEDPAGAELAKFLIAIGIHTGAESTLLPGAEFMAEAAKLQITYSVAKGTEMGMSAFATEFAALTEIGKSVLARKERDAGALEEDAESVERLSPVREVSQRVAG